MGKNNKRHGFERKFPKGNRKGEYRHHNQLTETEVGITEYLNPHEGFKGIIKHRFADFQVSEIALDGRVAKLTNTSIPQEFKKQEKDPSYDYKTVEKSPIEVLPQEIWEKLKHMVDNKDAAVELVCLDVEELSKDIRMQIHAVIENYFPRILSANTKKVDNRSTMEFTLAKNVPDRSDWPKNVGDYVHFLVYKECLDTLDATFKIAGTTKVPPEKFTYAGVKDRRAKTTQWFSVKRVQPWKLLMKTNRVLHNLRIGNLEFKNHPIKLGDLLGNQFRIAIRYVTADDEIICKCVSHVKEHGFVNYYGLQRFGNDKEAPTYMVGIKLLTGQFKEAVELILKPKKSDDPTQRLTHAKEEYARSKDAAKALKHIPGKPATVEEKLLKALEKNGSNDFVNSLEQIPRNARLLYINSFQSLIWNKMVSKRLTEFGYKPVVGDLIITDDVKLNETCTADTDEPENGEKESVILEENIEMETKSAKANVTVVTEANIDQYTIFDVVLPLPGYDIQYPSHLQEFYKAALEEQGLSLEMEKQKVKCYNLSGTYRKIMGMPKDLKWEIVRYNEINEDLIYSDLDELKNKPKPKVTDDGANKALIVSFTLSPASYATMVLREILKIDTSSSAHAKLSENSVTEKKKRIIDESVESTKVEEEVIGETSNSLLSNKDKYAQFMNSIFQSTSDDGGVKRQLEDDDVDVSKKIKTEEDVKNDDV